MEYCCPIDILPVQVIRNNRAMGRFGGLLRSRFLWFSLFVGKMAQLSRWPIPAHAFIRPFWKLPMITPLTLRPTFTCCFIGWNSNRRVETKFASTDAMISSIRRAPILTESFYKEIQNVGRKSGNPRYVPFRTNSPYIGGFYEFYHITFTALTKGWPYSKRTPLVGYSGKVRVRDFLARL